MSYYKYEPLSVLGNSNYKIYYDRSMITDRNIPKNRPDKIILNISQCNQTCDLQPFVILKLKKKCGNFMNTKH